MSDVKLEQKQSLSRRDAAVWLHALSKAFEHGGEAELPMPGGATIEFRLPGEVEAEFEVKVDGDEVEVESRSSGPRRRVPPGSSPEGTVRVRPVGYQGGSASP